MRQLDKILDIEIPTLRDGSPRAYLLALLCAFVAISIRTIADPYIVGLSSAVCFPAIMIASWAGGFAAGMFCVAVSVLGTWYFILPPAFSFALEPGHSLGVCVFSVLGAAKVVLICTTRAAVARYRSLSAELEVRVTERSAELQSTQAMLFQAQKMEALGQLTGGLAHDFNNMIAVVFGNLDIMRRRLAAGQTDVIRYLVNRRANGTPDRRAKRTPVSILLFGPSGAHPSVPAHVLGKPARGAAVKNGRCSAAARRACS